MSLANAVVYTNLTASNLEAEKAFFSEKLGLTVAPSDDPGGGFFVDGGGGARIFVYNSGNPKATNTVASFEVEDVRGTVKELKTKGVTFESYDMGEIKTDQDNVAVMGPMEAAWFKTPAGNILCVSNH